MQLIEEVVQKLLTVLVVESSELRILGNASEDVCGLKCAFVGGVVVLDELSECAGDLSLAAQHVTYIEVVEMPICEKVLGEVGDSDEALQRGVHVAGVSQVFKAHLADFSESLQVGVTPARDLVVLHNQVQLSCFGDQRVALLLMYLLVVLALGAAEENRTALAGLKGFGCSAVEASLSY